MLCLLLAVLAAAMPLRAASGETGTRTINASGNLNAEPSVDPFGNSEGYSAVLYNNRNGLPSSETNAIVQTDDGFIWIGSYAGLVRYDGNSFETLDSVKGVTSVRCLFTDSQNRLWIGCNDAGLFLVSGEEVHHWDKSSGFESLSVRTVAEAEDGTIYFGGTMGIGTIDASLEYTPVKDERFAGQTIIDLRRGGDGLVYGISNTGNMFTLKEGRVAAWFRNRDFQFGEPLAILPDPDHPGLLYVGTEEFICHGNPEQGYNSWEVRYVSPLQGMVCLEYIGGRVWICARTGVGRLETDGVQLLQNIPMNTSFSHIMTDRDGNLWITSSRQGVMKIVPNQFMDLFDLYGLPAEVVNSTCTAYGRLFIGTDHGLTVIENGKKLTSLPAAKLVTSFGAYDENVDLLAFLDDIRIRSVFRDSRNRLWICTGRYRGLIRYDGEEIRLFTEEDGLLSESVRTTYECRDGRILVATNKGVNVIEEDRVVRRYGQEEGLDVRMILTVAEGDSGEIIAGSDGGGIYVAGPDGLKQIGIEDGLKSEVVLRIRRSRFRDLYWVVTGNTLSCMTSDFHVKTIREFPFTNNYDVYENNSGDLWVLGSSGIYVVPSGDLEEDEPDEPVFLGFENGLPYIPTANSYSGLAPDGELYISGNEGVIKVNIDSPFTGTGSSRAALPYIDADGTRHYPDETGCFTLPGDAHKITVYPYVFNYSLTDPLVSYRLEGFDPTETTVSRSRLKPVDYTNLTIGAFRFVMTVKDPVKHSEQTVSFRIVKGREMSPGMAGTIIIILASLLLMCGVLICTSPYRKRGLQEDRLLTGLFLTNIVMSAGELLSFILEFIRVPLVRELMIAGNTVYYIAMVLFSFLLLVYTDGRFGPGRISGRKMKPLYGIPCALFSAAMIANLKTGWIFTIGEGNVFQAGLQGWVAYLPALPVGFYLLLSLIRANRFSRRLAVSGAFLTAAWQAGEFCYSSVSSTSLFYTLILTGICLSTMNHPTNEEAP